MEFTRCAAACAVSTGIVRLLVEERNADFNEPVIGWHRFFGDHRLHVTVIEAIVGKAVRERHGPVRQIFENRLRGVLNAVLLLHGIAAAQKRIALRNDGVTADIVVGINHENRKTLFDCANSSRNACGAGTDDNHVGLEVPLRRNFGFSGARYTQHHAAHSG